MRVPSLVLSVVFAAFLAAPAVAAEAPEGAVESTDRMEAEVESTASAAATERQDKIYEDYERLVRVMEIVESRYVQPVDTDQLFDGAIRGIMQSLDPYSVYIPPQSYADFVEEAEQQFGGIGITLAVEQDHVKVVATVEGMPAFRAGVQPGDYILKIDDRPVEEMKSLEEIGTALRGSEGTNVTLTLLRPTSGKEYTVVLTREEIPVSTIRGYRSDPRTARWDYMVDKDAKIGYIRLTKFAQNSADELDEAWKDLSAQGARALILDLRYNPGGLLDTGVAVADRFLDTGLIVRTRGRAGIHSESFARPYDTWKPAVPLALLINEYSASASEVVAGALKDHDRAVLVGTRTYGKGSVQSMLDLDGKGALKLTIAYYYTPSGRLVHRLPGAKEWGLDPDIAQAMTMEEQLKLRDEWRRAAGGEEPKSLGEGGALVIDTQLARALDILRGGILIGRENLTGK